MKAIFEFNLPEDNPEYNIFAKGEDMFNALLDFQNYLRQQEKYADTPDNIETIRERFIEILEDNSVYLDDLT